MDLRISIDDGNFYDLEVAGLLEKYNLKGIFYIPCNTILDETEIKELSKKHEIGGHTFSHKRLTSISREEAVRELQLGKDYLEDWIEKEVEKFAYPRGWFNQEIKDLCKATGYLEARTMKLGVTDISKYDNFEIPATFQLYPRAEYNGNLFSAFKKLYKQGRKDGYFNIVIHSLDIKKFNLWKVLEEILKYINEDTNPRSRKK